MWKMMAVFLMFLLIYFLGFYQGYSGQVDVAADLSQQLRRAEVLIQQRSDTIEALSQKLEKGHVK